MARRQPEKQLLWRVTAAKVFKLWLPKYECSQSMNGKYEACLYFCIHTLAAEAIAMAFMLRQPLFEQACLIILQQSNFGIHTLEADL